MHSVCLIDVISSVPNICIFLIAATQYFPNGKSGRSSTLTGPMYFASIRRAGHCEPSSAFLSVACVDLVVFL